MTVNRNKGERWFSSFNSHMEQDDNFSCLKHTATFHSDFWAYATKWSHLRALLTKVWTGLVSQLMNISVFLIRTQTIFGFCGSYWYWGIKKNLHRYIRQYTHLYICLLSSMTSLYRDSKFNSILDNYKWPQSSFSVLCSLIPKTFFGFLLRLGQV